MEKDNDVKQHLEVNRQYQLKGLVHLRR
jgi:hypothetical protein